MSLKITGACIAFCMVGGVIGFHMGTEDTSAVRELTSIYNGVIVQAKIGAENPDALECFRIVDAAYKERYPNQSVSDRHIDVLGFCLTEGFVKPKPPVAS